MQPKAKRIEKPAFVWKPHSPKQKQILYWWTRNSPDKNLSYAAFEGAVRSIKTASASYSFINWASYNYNLEDFALTAKTIGTCLRNVVRPLKKMLSIEPSYEIKEHRSNTEGYNLEISQLETGNTNTFYVYGGKDESSQDLIQGKTLAGILFDEAPLMPMSFINQGLARLSVEGAKAWFTLNPETPRHPFYVEFLDPLQEAKKVFYIHLTMDDNPSLSDEARERIRAQWPVGSVWHRRYVLGERAIAEGAVYDMFDVKKHVVYGALPQFSKIITGVDYGTSNATAFISIGKTDKAWIAFKEYYFDSRKAGFQKTDAEYSTDMAGFNDLPPTSIQVDPSAASFKLQLARDGFKNVEDADNSVLDGIREIAMGFSTNTLLIHDSCTTLIEQLLGYHWDQKAQVRGEDKPVKAEDHTPDALRYAFRKAMLKTPNYSFSSPGQISSSGIQFSG